MLPNRVAVYFTALAALAGGLVPVIGNLDFESTVGVVAGVGALATVVSVWLLGWQKYEGQEQAKEYEQQILSQHPPA